MTRLTEEIIRKIPGFKHVEGLFHYHLVVLPYEGKRIIHATKGAKGWYCFYMVNDIAASRNINYLEELQELYRGLTGEELIISP